MHPHRKGHVKLPGASLEIISTRQADGLRG